MKKRVVAVPRGVFNILEGGNKTGFPIVMLHGWPTNAYCWERVAAHMSSHFRIIAPDLRGLGDSERTMIPQAYRKTELAKDILQILDALQIDIFFLVGHCMGGIVAQEIALIVPEKVKRLVLINSVIINNLAANLRARKALLAQDGAPAWYQLFMQQPELIESMVKNNEDAWMRHYFSSTHITGSMPSDVINEYIRCYKIHNTPATSAYYYWTMNDDGRHWMKLMGSKIAMPTLYLYGQRDSVIILRYFNDVGDCFDSVKINTLKSGHYVPDEKPAEIAEQIEGFVHTPMRYYSSLGQKNISWPTSGTTTSTSEKLPLIL